MHLRNHSSTFKGVEKKCSNLPVLSMIPRKISHNKCWSLLSFLAPMNFICNLQAQLIKLYDISRTSIKCQSFNNTEAQSIETISSNEQKCSYCVSLFTQTNKEKRKRDKRSFPLSNKHQKLRRLSTPTKDPTLLRPPYGST